MASGFDLEQKAKEQFELYELVKKLRSQGLEKYVAIPEVPGHSSESIFGGSSKDWNLSSLISNVQTELEDCNCKIKRLGDPRPTIVEKRRYLLRVSQQFSELMKAAVDGAYSDRFFSSCMSDDGYDKHLRGVIQNTLTDFAEDMRLKGQEQHIVEHPRDGIPHLQKQVTRTVYLEEVKSLIRRSKGCELPGLFHPDIVGKLFTEQCQPWRGIASRLETKVLQAVLRTTHAILGHICADETRNKLARAIQERIAVLQTDVGQKIQELLDLHYEGHPITYSNCLVESVSRTRADRKKRAVQKSLKGFFETKEIVPGRKECRDIDISSLLSQLAKDTEVDLENDAISLAVDYSEAYYKVALKNFVNDVGVLAIEACLMQKLPTLFSPDRIFDMDDHDVTRFAGEDQSGESERTRCQEKQEILVKALVQLRQVDMHRLVRPSDTLAKHSGTSGHDIQSAKGSRKDSDAIHTVHTTQKKEPASKDKDLAVVDSVFPPSRKHNPFAVNQASKGKDLAVVDSVLLPSRKQNPFAVNQASKDKDLAVVDSVLLPSRKQYPLAVPQASAALKAVVRIWSDAPGTAQFQLVPMQEKEPNNPAAINEYQHICFSHTYRAYSCEEIRMTDYDHGQRYVGSVQTSSTPEPNVFGLSLAGSSAPPRPVSCSTSSPNSSVPSGSRASSDLSTSSSPFACPAQSKLNTGSGKRKGLFGSAPQSTSDVDSGILGGTARPNTSVDSISFSSAAPAAPIAPGGLGSAAKKLSSTESGNAAKPYPGAGSSNSSGQSPSLLSSADTGQVRNDSPFTGNPAPSKTSTTSTGAAKAPRSAPSAGPGVSSNAIPTPLSGCQPPGVSVTTTNEQPISSASNQPSRSGREAKKKCYECGELGHIASQCFTYWTTLAPS